MAAALLDMLAPWQERYRLAGTGALYAADEFYLLAGRELPSEEEYGDFPQIENGVGMARAFIAEMAVATAGRRVAPAASGASGADRVLLLTGPLLAPLLEGLVARYFGGPGIPWAK